MTHDQPGAPGTQAWVPQDAPAAPEPAPLAGSAPQSGYQQSGYQQSGYQQPGPAAPGPASYAPGFGQPPYAQGGYYAPAAPKPTPTLAIVGLVLAFLAPLFGLIVSIIALVRAKTDGTGRGLAIAGLIISIVITPIYAAVAIPVFLNQREHAQAAGPREAFEEMTDALAVGDCDVFMALSTSVFREQIGVGTCDDFALFVEMANADAVGVGNVPVTDVVVDGDRAVVSTLERVVATDGGATLEPFDYHMVQRDGAWLMDHVTLGE